MSRWRTGKAGTRGFTMLEVMVSLVLVSIATAVAALAMREDSIPEDRSTALREARLQAVETGVPVVVRIDTVVPSPILFLPDGRAIGLEVSPLTGRLHP